jgi:transposase
MATKEDGAKMEQKKIGRRVKRIGSVGQKSLGLFEDPGEEQASVKQRAVSHSGRAIRFEEPDPRRLRFGDVRLDEHLRTMGLRDGLVVRQLLSEQDWSVFESGYSPVGRPGYAPRLMAGVVLFGLMRGVSSLRELERFARGDLECMWVSGGITPDHSILGRFIMRHEQALSGPLFEAIVQTALKRTGSGRERLAGDGTVLEAMSSRFALIKREAVQEQWQRERQQQEQQQEQQQAAAQESAQQERTEQAGEPGGEPAEQETEQEAQQQPAQPSALERASQALAERPKAKAVVVGEPEAGLLKLKNGRGSRPAYQAAVLANAARVVVDAQVHSTSEQAALLELLQPLDSTQTQELLLDAGFNNYDILELTVAREISLLCPEQAQATYSQDAAESGESDKRHFPIRLFRYVEQGDYYVCPAGQAMHPCRRHAGHVAQGKRPYVQYATPACSDCTQRSQCTQREARTVQRTEGRELKEALRQVMEQPQARRVFAQRKAMVEPVFSALRERQGLNRLRRRGLDKVRLEFRLHLMAYNLGRALAYVRQGFLPPLLRHFAALLDAITRYPASLLPRTRQLACTTPSMFLARFSI